MCITFSAEIPLSLTLPFFHNTPQISGVNQSVDSKQEMKQRNGIIKWVLLGVLVPVVWWAFAGGTGDGNKGDKRDSLAKEHPFLPETQGSWARRTLDSLSLDEKIGQLFMIAAYSNKNEQSYAYIEKLVKEEQIGGLIFMQGGPGRQVNLINRYQEAAEVPLLIAQDSEWGLAMRLDSSLKYPRNMTLGAIANDTLIYQMGREVGEQCRRAGVHINFAPVVDVNNNPSNPVINDRSFGENRERVANKGIAMYKGMERGKAIACAKHFPGHGDTDADSHKELPVILHERERLDSIELYPFKKMIEAGVPSVMVAHLYIPALDNTPNQASTLSPKIVRDLLKTELGFHGLVITDALGMQGVAKYYQEGEVDLKALMAGNDVLLFSGNVPKAKEMIKKAIESGEVTQGELDRAVLKILIAKEWLGLNQERTVPSLADASPINTPEATVLRKSLYQNAITLLNNENKLVPITRLEERTIAHVQVGGPDQGPFYQTLRKYGQVDYFYLASVSNANSRAAVLKKLKPYNTVIVSVQDMSKYAGRNFGISQGTREFITGVNKLEGTETLLTLFGSPYSLKFFDKEDAIVVAYESSDDAQVAAAEAIFGAISITGTLPVTASPKFKEGMGQKRRAAARLQMALPEAAGMDAATLLRIDSLANDAIKTGATPGCAIMVIKGNRLVYEKAFGKTEYDKGTAIDPYSTLYDVASVTKLGATTLATMHLVEEGKIGLDSTIATYLPEFDKKGKRHIKVRNLLAHDAGFEGWIPFYVETIDEEQANGLDSAVYHSEPNERYCVPVTQGIYMCVDYQDSIWMKIVDSDLPNKKPRYSDLGMITMARIIEKVSGTTLDKYVDSVFYQPMGMNNSHFNPAICASDKVCAPTELDNYWRNMKVQGYVHDQAAAMLGGFSGHAGLFSNLYDLGKLIYMLKNGGYYGGVQYFKPETINTFNTQQNSDYRKGLGFDKVELDDAKRKKGWNPVSDYSTKSTFGHSGFTGIGVWTDPEYDICYVFLSNRTFPSSENKKLIQGGYRTKIMDVIYESIWTYEGTLAEHKK